MDREVFSKKLRELVDEVKESRDPALLRSGAMLLGIKAALDGGDDFMEALADHMRHVIERQREMIIEDLGKM